MEDEHKSLEPQQDNETLRDTATLIEMMDDKIEETSSQDTPDETINSDDDNPIEDGESGDDIVEETTAEETIDKTLGGTIDVEETQIKDEASPPRGDKRDGIKKEDAIKELCKYKSSLDCDKFCNILKFLFLILLSLSGIVLLVLVLFGVWNVKMNRSSVVLIFGLILLFIVAIIVLSFMLTTSNRRYGSALNRLDLLITRIGFMKDDSKMLIDVDRELQFIARILESSNEKSLNL